MASSILTVASPKLVPSFQKLKFTSQRHCGFNTVQYKAASSEMTVKTDL